jgi:hypothetical protein
MALAPADAVDAAMEEVRTPGTVADEEGQQAGAMLNGRVISFLGSAENTVQGRTWAHLKDEIFPHEDFGEWLCAELRGRTAPIKQMYLKARGIEQTIYADTFKWNISIAKGHCEAVIISMYQESGITENFLKLVKLPKEDAQNVMFFLTDMDKDTILADADYRVCLQKHIDWGKELIGKGVRRLPPAPCTETPDAFKAWAKFPSGSGWYAIGPDAKLKLKNNEVLLLYPYGQAQADQKKAKLPWEENKCPRDVTLVDNHCSLAKINYKGGSVDIRENFLNEYGEAHAVMRILVAPRISLEPDNKSWPESMKERDPEVVKAKQKEVRAKRKLEKMTGKASAPATGSASSQPSGSGAGRAPPGRVAQAPGRTRSS